MRFAGSVGPNLRSICSGGVGAGWGPNMTDKARAALYPLITVAIIVFFWQLAISEFDIEEEC